MDFMETKEILNRLLFEFNGHNQETGILKVTEGMNGCLYIEYKNEQGVNTIKINSHDYDSAGKLVKDILNKVF